MYIYYIFLIQGDGAIYFNNDYPQNSCPISGSKKTNAAWKIREIFCFYCSNKIRSVDKLIISLLDKIKAIKQHLKHEK